MDKKYWEHYYSKPDNAPDKPSLFAQFVLEKHLAEGDSLIELGCGNGRDSAFFARHGIRVLATDQSEKGIEHLEKENFMENLSFRAADFTKLPDGEPYDAVYSRFTLHSINQAEESAVISWAYRNLASGGRFLIEARGTMNELYRKGEAVKDEPDAFIHDDHYRRFLRKEAFERKLSDAGFRIESSEEKIGFAPFRDTDYHFLRVIAYK